MERGFDLLHMHATARTAPGAYYDQGEVIAYCEAPQVCIRRADGTTLWWRVDLCTFSDPSTTAPEKEDTP